MRESVRIARAMGVRKAGRQIRRSSAMEAARKDAKKSLDSFFKENAIAIEIIKDIYAESLQHVLSLHLDLERQAFMHRHMIEAETLTRLWYERAEVHEGCGWILCDLEYEKDRRDGKLHQWRKHNWSGIATSTCGEQLRFEVAERAM